MNQRTHGHVWAWTIAHFQRSQDGYERFDRHYTCVGEVSLDFQLELNTLGISSFLTNINLKDWGRENVEAIPRKLNVCGHIGVLIETFACFWR